MDEDGLDSKPQWMPRIAWGLAAGVVLATLFMAIDAGRRGELSGIAADQLVGIIIAPVFACSGALIIARQPRNIIGWLLMVPALGSALIDPISTWVGRFEVAPADVSVWLMAGLWLENWSWLLFIFPIFHLLQVFPTGRILTRRWRWLTYLEVGMFTVFVSIVTFQKTLGPSSDEATWSVPNPIGFLPDDLWDGVFSTVWTLGLLVLVLGGASSTITRFRRAGRTERQQIEWLLYALVMFAVVYALVAVTNEGAPNIVLDILFMVSVIAIPIAMTMAVLRFRLFDIELIIRKTLIYGFLTGLLAAVYFGSVVALQTIFRGEGSSSLTVAASTLLITASFTPLRRRIQTLIDRRLFRRKYDTQLVIERFGGAAQNQAKLDSLSADLVAIVGEIIQPRSVVVWIRDLSRTSPPAR